MLATRVLLLADEATDSLLLPIYIFCAVVVLGILIFCAYLCARNGRWGWFIMGFICTPLLWIVGALLGSAPGRRPKRYRY